VPGKQTAHTSALAVAVYEPASQAAQAVAPLYWPAGQSTGEQELEPAAALVNAAHVEQAVAPAAE